MTLQLAKTGVVGDVQCGNIRVIFCNGVENNEEGAKASAKKISRSYFDTQVHYFHNDTTLKQFFQHHSFEEQEHQSHLARQFAQFIRSHFFCPDANIFLFAHSHGAMVTEASLNLLTPEERARISVTCYGGATMLPKNLAGRVSNVIKREDLIAHVGNHANETIYKLRYEIDQKEQTGLSFNDAVYKYACEEVQEKMTRNYNAMQPLDQLKLQLSFMQQREATALIFVAYIVTAILYRTQEIHRTLSQYDIQVIAGRPKPPLEDAFAQKNGFAIIGAAVRNLIKGAEHVLHNHNFEGYL